MIYVPYRSLKSVFSQESATAFLPYGEYLKLLDAVLGSSLRKPSQRPVSGVIKSSQYVGKIEGDLAKITATMAVESLTEGWAEVPVRFGEAAIGEITSDSGQVLLRKQETGITSLLLPKSGEHNVTLQLAAQRPAFPLKDAVWSWKFLRSASPVLNSQCRKPTK
ncbi:MAG: hypothetical protein QM756_15060 [Polyangiaceae bacterium]